MPALMEHQSSFDITPQLHDQIGVWRVREQEGGLKAISVCASADPEHRRVVLVECQFTQEHARTTQNTYALLLKVMRMLSG